MKITIDASQMVYETGVSVYTRNLIKSLTKVDNENTYQIFGGSLRRFHELGKKIDILIENKKNFNKILFPLPPAASDFIFNRIGINIDTFTGKTDVFHSSDWAQPQTSAYKVTTIHDLVPFLFPKLTHPKIIDVHKRRLERVKKYVDKIIVPSDTTKIDLIKLGFKEERVVVIPEAVDADLKKPSIKEISLIKKKYRILGDYLLAVGTKHPRKNVERIISAFEKVRIDHSLKLVFIGEAKKPVSVRNVVFLGHIPREDVSKVYCGSEALIYPSLYEGFGLPVIEAYSLGVPVLTSNIGSLKEIGEGAAVLVDPYDVNAITEGIKHLLSVRDDYIRKGKIAAGKYSWDITAKKTLKVYMNCKQ